METTTKETVMKEGPLSGLIIPEGVDKDTYLALVDSVIESLGVNPDKVRIDSDFEADLGGDSLDLVEIVLSVQEEFGVDISEEAEGNIHTVRDLYDFIVTHRK